MTADMTSVNHLTKKRLNLFFTNKQAVNLIEMHAEMTADNEPASHHQQLKPATENCIN